MECHYSANDIVGVENLFTWLDNLKFLHLALHHVRDGSTGIEHLGESFLGYHHPSRILLEIHA